MSKSIQYLTEEEIFALARAASESSDHEDSKGFTQKEIAEALDVSEGSVSKMMNGESKMLSLAVRWLQMRVPVVDWRIETDDEGKPVRYFKAVQEVAEDD